MTGSVLYPNERTAGATRLGFMLNHYARGSDLTGSYNPSERGIAANDAQSRTQAILLVKTVAATAVGAFVGYKVILILTLKTSTKSIKLNCLKLL